MTGQIQVINTPEFYENMKELMETNSFLQALDISGLADVYLDKYAVKQILKIDSDTTLDHYDIVGKRNNVTGIYHKLEKHYPDKNNKPRYRFKEVIEFKNNTKSYR